MLFLPACQPLQYAVLSSSEPGLEDSESFNSRSFQKEFRDIFLSEKLDMVFIMDTGHGMEAFYQKPILGPDFPNRLNIYDWKLGWTDMSVDMKKIGQQEVEGGGGKEEGGCNLLSGIILFPLGILAGAVNMAGWGLDSLGDCVINLFEGDESSKKSYANGDFLPFEYKGKKIKKQGGFAELSPAVENYNSVFDHTFRLKNFGSYDAPEQKALDSYPFMAVALSMIRGHSPPKESEGSQPGKAFFREDSLIVYVLFTVRDMQYSIKPKDVEQNLKSFFGSEKRVKLILVTAEDNSSLLCGLKFQNMSHRSSKLKELSQHLGSKPLNICSPNLTEELFNEISKSLYPKDLFFD